MPLNSRQSVHATVPAPGTGSSAVHGPTRRDESDEEEEEDEDREEEEEDDDDL